MTQGPFYLLTPEEYAAYKAWLDSQPSVIWQDRIQEDAPLWGFDGLSTANPGKVNVPPDDANGVNLSRVADPVRPGFCLRHFADLNAGSYIRSQVLVAGHLHQKFNESASSPEGVYLEHECYLPEILSANGDAFSWLSLQDIHVRDESGDNRSWLGLFVAQDGSMRAMLSPGGTLYAPNSNYQRIWSRVPLPVGRWFKIKTHFIKSNTPTTVRVWFDGELAIELPGLITSLPSNKFVEWYIKVYGGVQKDNPWGKVIKFFRNCRITKG